MENNMDTIDEEETLDPRPLEDLWLEICGATMSAGTFEVINDLPKDVDFSRAETRIDLMVHGVARMEFYRDDKTKILAFVHPNNTDKNPEEERFTADFFVKGKYQGSNFDLSRKKLEANIQHYLDHANLYN